jgi:hypothetical protein
LEYAFIVELTAGGSFRPNDILQGDVKPVVHWWMGGSVMASADALGHFNWENLPRKAIFSHYCEADIKGEDLA